MLSRSKSTVDKDDDSDEEDLGCDENADVNVGSQFENQNSISQLNQTSKTVAT